MHTGQPGPMITSSSRGRTARRPKRAMACSWLPQTCMRGMGARPMAFTSRWMASERARARCGSRYLSSWKRSATAAVPGHVPPGRHLAADVCGHEVGLGRVLEDGLEEGQGLLHLLVRNAAYGEAHVVEHVVAGNDRPAHDVEAELLHHAEQVHPGGPAGHREALA